MEREELRVESPRDLDLTSRARGEHADERLAKVARVYSTDEPRRHDHQGGEDCDRAYEPPANDRIIHGQLTRKSARASWGCVYLIVALACRSLPRPLRKIGLSVYLDLSGAP